jgi:hypothetical protein
MDIEHGPFWDEIHLILEKNGRMNVVYAIERKCEVEECPCFTGAGAPGHHCSMLKVPIKGNSLSCERA